MATKAGRAKFEDVKKGAKLYYVNGFRFSEDIVKIFVTDAYRGEQEVASPFSELFEWFEFVEMDGRKKTSFVDSLMFSDVGIDTLRQKAEPAISPNYPEAQNAVFITEWHALQYIRRLRRLYPGRGPAIASHRGLRKQTRRKVNMSNKEWRDREEEEARDETFALAP